MRRGEAFAARVGAVTVGLTLALAASAGAATIEVETDVDEFGSGGTSACTLREAIEAARTNDGFGGCPAGSGKDKIVMPGSVVLQRDVGAGNAGGDLDYNKNEKLTIVGDDDFSFSMPQISGQPGWEERALEVTKGKVALRGLDISDFDSSEAAGGAIRATGAGTSLKLSDVNVSENRASARGGAIACEGCKRLSFGGIFRLNDNAAGFAEDSQGGAVWSDAPTVMKGQSFPNPIFGNSQISDNAQGGQFGDGGAIYVTDDLTISNVSLRENTTSGTTARGGAIATQQPVEGATVALKDVTIAGNSAQGRAGAIDMTGPNGLLKLTRVVVTQNTGNGFGGAIFTQTNAKITESALNSNSVGPQSQGTAQGGAFYVNPGTADTARKVRFTRSSITNNQISAGTTNQGAGLFLDGVDLRLENSTVSSNTAPLAGADGGGIFMREDNPTIGVSIGGASIEFTTFRDNVAGAGSTEGDAIFSDFGGDVVSIRASIMDEGADGCALGSQGGIASGGFNVEDVTDTDCGITAPTDSNGSDFLNLLGLNGSPPIGAPPSQPINPESLPLTHAFTNDSSAALDIVPPAECEIAGKRLKTDQRGVPRPAEEGCDAGATERVACRGVFVVGPNAHIGRNGRDQIQGSHTENDVVLSQGGDDQINIYGDEDTVCAGEGDDSILAGENSSSPDDIDGGPGTDFISYNNGGPVTLDLDAQGVIGPSTGVDELHSIEDAQGSEGNDSIFGSEGPNLLIGGGDPDLIRGRGGIDVIDAKDGEADVEINCGPGDNSQEKARIDEGLDSDPVSC